MERFGPGTEEGCTDDELSPCLWANLSLRMLPVELYTPKMGRRLLLCHRVVQLRRAKRRYQDKAVHTR